MINPADIQINDLPSVALANKNQLPKTPSIYFAINSLGEVLYIGRSQNPRGRWYKHQCYEQLCEEDGAKIAYVDCPRELLDEVEQALITHFKPQLNIRRPLELTQTTGGGAVINTLKDLLESRSKTRYWLWKQTGLAQNTVYRLHDDPKYIPGGEVMNAICEALRVQPGEWLKWVPKNDEKADGDEQTI